MSAYTMATRFDTHICKTVYDVDSATTRCIARFRKEGDARYYISLNEKRMELETQLKVIESEMKALEVQS